MSVDVPVGVSFEKPPRSRLPRGSSTLDHHLDMEKARAYFDLIRKVSQVGYARKVVLPYQLSAAHARVVAVGMDAEDGDEEDFVIEAKIGPLRLVEDED